MIIGSLLAAATDLQFSLLGYLWMTGHVLTQAAYVLYVRKVKLEINLSEDEMVFYNKMLSLPFFVVLAFANSEIPAAFYCPCWELFSFKIVWILSGLMGLLISLTSFLCMNVAGPTSFAILGSLNKVPLTILGYILFAAPMDWKNVSSVCFGLLAGLVYSKAKFEEDAVNKNQKNR